VGPSGSTYAYAFAATLPAAGTYQAAVADLQFPSQLTALAFAVAQDGVILKQSPAAATLNVDANAHNVVLLVSAQPPSSGSTSANGLFDVNLQSTGASPKLVFDKTQSVSGGASLFDSQTLMLGVSGGFDASLADLKFPDAFDDLALVVSRGSQVLGKIYGAGKFSFAATPGAYQLTFVATPAASQQFGLYSFAIVFSPPTVNLSASASTVAVGDTVQLSWSATDATSCTASGGSWTGSKATSQSSEAVVVTATTTYMLSCTGAGGTVPKSVTVTATPKTSSSGSGGGSMDPAFLLLAAALAAAGQYRRRRDIFHRGAAPS
jgi:MYXO-CTERM domain-containing protein